MKVTSFSQRLFRMLLLVYPRGFRREYGPQMAQAFGDCQRASHRHGVIGPWVLWWHTFSDLLRSAPREHLEKFREENSPMTNLQRNAIALASCLAIIVIAFLLLSYGRSHEVSAILLFGRTLDALVTAGIIGNLIIFGLKFTRVNSLKTALWTMLAVNSILFVAACLIGGRVDPNFKPGALAIAHVVSFVFWAGVHWAWSKTTRQLAVISD
jgi:hypothetical protein